jgi:Ca-activated chloride channel family protein
MKLKNIKKYSLLYILPFLLLHASISGAENKEDKTLSPYFKVMGNGRGNIENLPLQDTSAQVDIVGVIADVKVRQVYQNRGGAAIEAIYVFPGSSKAAVYGMKMTIGERVVVAKIKERKAAKVAYNQAKKQGKRASLLEQQRPNVFQMNVANIMPGDEIIVELSYTELIVPEQGIYEFVYPAVVGPRYSETVAENAPETESWIVNPYLQQDVAPPYTFNIKAFVSVGIPIQALSSPSHKVTVDYKEQGTATVHLTNKDNSNGDIDYILRYQLRGQEINTGLLLYKGEEENFFLLMSQPPEKVISENIPPREYIFVVDVSGSMHGFPLNTSKNLMAELLSNLRPTDSFNILFFSGSSSVLSETSLPVTKANIEKAIAMMEKQQGSGSTQLLPALQRAMALPAERSTSRSFIMVTDGYVSVEKEVFQFVKDNLNNANFFSFGIGSSINRFLIEGLARAGKGEPFVITSSAEAFQVAQRFREYIETPVLTGININFNNFEAYDVEPKKIPDLFAERPLVIYGKWRGKAQGKIEIKGHQGQSDYIQTIDVSKVEAKPENQAIRYLWARNKIAELGDFEKLSPDSERKAEITTLGLTYNLLTEYTSFIAIDEIIANSSGNSQKVKQPLPLPKGVSNLAVGGIVPTAPEPGVLNLLAVIGVIFGMSLISRIKTRKV